jgi:uncharacterized membrane protein YbjE (DUF340 family)
VITMKTAVLCNVLSCVLVEFYLRFRVTPCVLQKVRVIFLMLIYIVYLCYEVPLKRLRDITSQTTPVVFTVSHYFIFLVTEGHVIVIFILLGSWENNLRAVVTDVGRKCSTNGNHEKCVHICCWKT